MYARHWLVPGMVALAGVLSVVRGAETPPFRVTPEEIAARLRQARPERPLRWTQIPWTGNLLEARAASRSEQCPVFLFSLDGNLASGRC